MWMEEDKRDDVNVTERGRWGIYIYIYIDRQRKGGLIFLEPKLIWS